MKHQYLEFSIKHQKIERTDTFEVVGGSRGYLWARFTFCDDWSDETIKYAVFTGGGRPYPMLIENGACEIPWEVLRLKRFYVGCIAGELLTTNPARVDVGEWCLDDTDPNIEPTPTMFYAIIKALRGLETVKAEEIAAAVERYMLENSCTASITFDYLTEETEEDTPCTGIALDKTVLTFNGTGQETITANLTPTDTTETLKWMSNNTSVATVSNGIVTAHANGSATITATCGGCSASCTVEVSGITDTVAVTGITLNQNTASVQVGDTITLTATVEPDNATNKTVTWTSDNESVATVEDGVVTGVSEGTASIGAMTADGGFSAICYVTVNEAVVSNYKNLFDKNTMVTASEGITGAGVVGNYNWGLARVPVKANTVYSLKNCATNITYEPKYYVTNNGAYGFANIDGTLISRLAFGYTQAEVDAGTNGANAILADYAHGTLTQNSVNGKGVEWITFTTPENCAYLLFNTSLVAKADEIQLEEGDTIHDYYLPFVGGVE